MTAPGEVFSRERQHLIATFVAKHGRAQVSELATTFGVSNVTIRKDLVLLELEGRLIRAHGGAIAVGGLRSDSGTEGTFHVRELRQPARKDVIGRLGASMITDGESIAFDASTTALAVARHIRAGGPWTHLTILTNGLRIASELAGTSGITVAMPGGLVRWEALSLVGHIGDGVFGRINVQKAFLGAAGFTIETGLSDATEEEAQIKRAMTASAREVIAIVDSTKWERSAFATFCRTEQLTGVITDDGAPRSMVDALRARGIAVRTASTEHDVAQGGLPSADDAQP